MTDAWPTWMTPQLKTESGLFGQQKTFRIFRVNLFFRETTAGLEGKRHAWDENKI